MPLDLSGPQLIIQAYNQGLQMKQQRETRQAQQQYQQQQLKLANDEFQQRKKEFDTKSAEEKAWHDAQVNKYKADFTLEQRKNARTAAVNAYEKGVEYTPTQDEVAYGAQAVTPEMIAQHNQMLAAQQAAAAGAKTTAEDTAHAPALKLANDQKLEAERLKSERDAREALALSKQNNDASMSRTKAEINGRSQLAAAEFARKNKVDDQQFIQSTANLLTQVSDGTVGLDEIAKSVPNIKERNLFLNTARAQGIQPLSKTAKGDVTGAQAMLDGWKSISELNGMLNDAGVLGVFTDPKISGKIKSIEATIGGLAKSVEGTGARISDNDVKRMMEAIPGRTGSSKKFNTNNTKVEELAKFIEAKFNRGLTGLTPVQKAHIRETYGFATPEPDGK